MNRSCKKTIAVIAIIGCIQHNFITSSSTQTNSWPIITRNSRSILPPDLQKEAQNTKLSAFKPTVDDLKVLYQNYPNGSTLFPNNSDLATTFNTLIQTIQQHPETIEFLRKIQITYLNQLYGYIIKIYTNLTLTNLGTTSSNGAIAVENINNYLTDEAEYAFNKKKLIMNHILNLIQAQLGSFIIACIPTLPTDLAVTFGQMFIQNDYGIDLAAFTQKQTDQTIIEQQNIALNVLTLYIDFFQKYTNYLNKLDATGSNQYFQLAQAIQNYLKNTVNLMNPVMFFYDIESMRSIQFIPFVASTLEKNTKNIPWAPSIVNAAKQNLMMNGHQIAYFTDGAGNKTTNQNAAQSLYLLTEVEHSLFEEELLAQPQWLNDLQGCTKIVSACLGNSAALIGMKILDPTLEAILVKATNNQKNVSPQQAKTQTQTLSRKKK